MVVWGGGSVSSVGVGDCVALLLVFRDAFGGRGFYVGVVTGRMVI